MERLARLAGIKAQIGTSADQETMVASRHWCMQRTANAVAESFFNLLKREWMRRWVYRTRTEARQGVFDYIEMFCNPTRKHARNGMLSLVEFERQREMRTEGFKKTRGNSTI